MNRISVIVVAAALLGTCSCASLLQGTTEQVTVMSDPSGATATLSNGETHVTPFTMAVPRQQDLQFHFSKPGYQSTDVADDSQIEGGYLAADFFTFIGWPIDAATGAYFAHQQSTVIAHLEPEQTAAPGASSKADVPSPQRKASSGTASKNTN
jgi:hypothetical protein